MTSSNNVRFTFEDLIKVLNINSENYSEIIDSFIIKYLDIKESGKREIYRFRFSEIDSVAVTVSDITDILETKSNDTVIIDFALKYQLENNTFSALALNKNKVLNFDDIKSSTSTDELLSKIKEIGVINNFVATSVKKLPYVMKGFAVKGDMPEITTVISVSHLPNTEANKYYTNNLKIGNDIPKWPEHVFTININIGISNYKSRYMR